MELTALNARIRDRISLEWLTPTQRWVWDQLMRFDGPPHRVINVYGREGVGKSFLGWMLERERLATYGQWHTPPAPTHPRLTLDNAPTDHLAVRSIRPLVDKLGVQQVILLTRNRADEPAMPAFELTIHEQDMEHFYANVFRHLRIPIPEATYPNFAAALATLD